MRVMIVEDQTMIRSLLKLMLSLPEQEEAAHESDDR
ncbi:unknown [Clostridium sp. CAG:226]|nr:unknown [Clostridium sp. CAG:226]